MNVMRRLNRPWLQCLWLPCVIAVSGCNKSPDGFSDMSRATLIEHSLRCRDAQHLGPGRAVICGNVERECKARSADAGYRLC